MQSLLMLPPTVRDQVLGLVELFDETGARDYTPKEIHLAQRLASQAANAIDHARMFAEEEQRAAALAHTLGGYAELLESGELGALQPEQHVLDNLLGNAFKFTPPGGRIAIHVRQEEFDAVLQVSDTGIGIPEHHLEHIFERFYQVDGSPARRYGGIGLGLALVKEIVQAHGGQVSAQSQVGQGSTFRVTLPLG